MADRPDTSAETASPKHAPHTTEEIAEFFRAIASASTALEGLLEASPVQARALTIAQWKTLARIDEDPAAAASPAKMARNLSMTPQGVRRGVKKLMESEFIERQGEGEGASASYNLTPAGKEALARVNEEFARIAVELSERRGALRFDAAVKTIERSLTFIAPVKPAKKGEKATGKEEGVE